MATLNDEMRRVRAGLVSDAAQAPVWSPTIEQYNCRALRVKKGWTVAEMAAATGVPKRTIYNFEAGERQPQLRTIVRIEAALGLPLGALSRRQRGRTRYFWPAELTC